MRYCATRFACRVPSWRLPLVGNVVDLVTEGGEEVGLVHVAQCADAHAGVGLGGTGGNWAGGSGENSSASCVSTWFGQAISRRVWKRLRVGHHHLGEDVEAKRRRLLQHDRRDSFCL